MLRRHLRVLCFCLSVALILAATVTQFVGVQVRLPNTFVTVSAEGLVFIRDLPRKWSISIFRQPAWEWKLLVEAPHFSFARTFTFFFFSWWSILVAWVLLATIIWRLTRPLTKTRAFPVETLGADSAPNTPQSHNDR